MANNTQHTCFRGRSYRNQKILNPDFSNADMRGADFTDATLESANFSHVDLRGVSFINATLVGANFNDANAGLTLRWTVLLAVGSLLLAVLSGCIVGYACGAFGTFLFSTEVLVPQLSGIALVLLTLFGFFMIRQGLGVALGVLAITMAVVMILFLVLSKASPGETLFTLLSMIILQPVMLAGALAGTVLGALTLAVAELVVRRFSLLLFGLGILTGAVPSIVEAFDNSTTLSLPIALAGAGILTVILVLLSVYMGRQCLRGNKNYALLQTIAIFIATFKGTNFSQANLTDASFIRANLRHTKFSQAILTRTYWFNAAHLEQSLISGTYLEKSEVREVAITLNGRNAKFDHYDLRGVNLQSADLTKASFVGANLSEANLREANLSGAKLAQAQLYRASLTHATLTGAYIQDWGISPDTHLEEIECDYVFMRLPTEDDPDVCRKPDNKRQKFEKNDFSDFIAPLIKMLDIYRHQNIDPREVGKSFKTLDLYHHDGIDPKAAAIAFTQLTQEYPDADLEIVSLEGPAEDKVNIKARVAGTANRDELNRRYFAAYQELQTLPYSDLQSLLTGMQAKEQEIERLNKLLMIALEARGFYINVKAGGDIGDVSGLTAGNVDGIVNPGNIEGNTENTVAKPPDAS